jgi:ribonuclease Z
VKRLLLTHISARYLGKQSQELEDEAKKIFENVQVVKDFDIVTVERIKHHEGR